MKKVSLFMTVMLVMGLLAGAGLVFSPRAEAGKAKDIIFSTANPLYPAFAEQIGVNLYLNSLIGLTQTHPALKGKYKLKVYDKGMLYGNQNQALEAVANGALQMTYSGPHFLEEMDPAWKVGETPGVFENWGHFLRTMDTPAWRALHQKMAKEKGVTIVKWLFDTGTWFLFTKTGPIKSMADIKNQKIRFAGGEAFAKALKGLNAMPIALPYTEVVTALQTNMIEGLLTDFTGGVGFYELKRYTKYAVLVPFGNQPICMVANTKWWESLDPKVRQALSTPFSQIDASSFYSAFEKKGIEAWRRNPKLVAVEFKPEQVRKWQDTMKASFQDIFSKIDAKYLKAIDSAR